MDVRLGKQNPATENQRGVSHRTKNCQTWRKEGRQTHFPRINHQQKMLGLSAAPRRPYVRDHEARKSQERCNCQQSDRNEEYHQRSRERVLASGPLGEKAETYEQ